jgi:predicted PurR-regulated permease PerM
MKSEFLLSLLLSTLIGYLVYIIMAPFLEPVFWAMVFVILFYPYYRWILRRVTRNRTQASLLACFTIALFLMIPLSIMGTVLANELLLVYEWAEDYLKSASVRGHTSTGFLASYIQAFLGNYFDISTLDIQVMVADAIKESSAFVANGLKDFLKNFAEFVLNLVLAFFTMYFLFKDGDSLLALVKDLIPLSESYKKRIIKKNRLVISATLNGGLVVGALQGFLGGVAFWFLGVPAPILWGFVMLLMSFIPGIGTALVWGPAVIYLLIKTSYMKAVILFFWGALIVGLADNLLRPVIVSGRTNLHPLLLFFSILGAVNVFGLIGIIAGPILLSIAISMVEIYHETLKSRRTWAG